MVGAIDYVAAGYGPEDLAEQDDEALDDARTCTCGHKKGDHWNSECDGLGDDGEYCLCQRFTQAKADPYDPSDVTPVWLRIATAIESAQAFEAEQERRADAAAAYYASIPASVDPFAPFA